MDTTGLIKIEGNTKPCRISLLNIGAKEIAGALMIATENAAWAQAMVEAAARGEMTEADRAFNRRRNPPKYGRMTRTERFAEWEKGGEA